MTSWKTSVELETRSQIEKSKTQNRSVKKLEEEKRAAHKVTCNRLNLYVYAVIKDKLEPPKGPIIQEATKSLRQYIRLHSLENARLDKLIQLFHAVHGKQREFTTELVAILQKETLLQDVNLSKSNNHFN